MFFKMMMVRVFSLEEMELRDVLNRYVINSFGNFGKNVSLFIIMKGSNYIYK